jgi:heat shock protein HslJ
MTPRWLLLLCALGVVACAVPPGPTASAAPPPPAAPLTGTRWVGVVEGGPDARTLPRLELTSNGRLAGFTGCNMMSGTWTEEGGAVRFGPIISTKRFCAGPEGEVEKRVLAALAPGARAVREGERLVLIAPSGARFEFSPAAAS